MVEGSGSFTPEQIKHLELLQAIINRHGSGSFLIKGWTLTLVTTLVGLSLQRSEWQLSLTALMPVIGFWLLDSYFLQQERLVRKLYDAVRQPGTTVEPFSMSTTPYRERTPFLSVAMSPTIIGFYGVLATVSLASLAAGAASG